MTKQIIVSRDSLRDMLNAAPFDKQIDIVGRALVALVNDQTNTGADARTATLTASSYIKRRTLDSWQVHKWAHPGKNGYPRLCKYARQLNSIAIAKAGRQQQNLPLAG